MEKTIKVMALLTNWKFVNDFLIEHLNQSGINDKDKNEICLACEEIYVNISNYAYPQGQGYMEVSLFYNKLASDVSVVFKDEGMKFNPLDVRNPELHGTASERKIGGLGIFMARNLTDKMEYTYENGKNKLRLIKSVKV